MTFNDVKQSLRTNVRDYGMYLALAVIMAVFAFIAPGFMSSRNIADLINQTGYIAVLAVGMTLIIVIRHIDLSVGFLAGLLGAVAAIGMSKLGFSVWIIIPFVLVAGTVAGLLTALPVAKLRVPSFVASLAGWLIYRGLLLMVTGADGTVTIEDEFFLALGNGYIPDFFAADSDFLPGVHKLTLLLGVVTWLLYLWTQFRSRSQKQKYGFSVIPTDMFAIKLVLITALLGYITWIMAGYNGLSWTAVIVLLVVVGYDFFTQNTVLGRHIYAVGGNPEAAELSGISVKKITFFVFGSMGFLTALSGILFTSRLHSATPTAGTLFELDTIAAAYIGGVSAAGGVGKIANSLIGALVYMALKNGMNLAGTDESLQYVIRGGVLLAAVIFDVATRNAKR